VSFCRRHRRRFRRRRFHRRRRRRRRRRQSLTECVFLLFSLPQMAVMTIAINGSTMPLLISKLGILKVSKAKQQFLQHSLEARSVFPIRLLLSRHVSSSQLNVVTVPFSLPKSRR